MNPDPGHDSLANTGNARTLEQREQMEKVLTTGVCPFCEIDMEINTIVRETTYWRLLLNAYPYPHHAHHLILVPKRHVIDITNLSSAEWADWGLLNKWAIEEYKLPGGGLVFRFGSLEYSAGTIAHLHSHIQVPDRTGLAIAVFQKSPALLAVLQSTNAAGATPQ